MIMEIFVSRLCQCQYSGHDIVLYTVLLMYYTIIMHATNGGNWVGKGCTGYLYHYFQLSVNLQLCHSKRFNFKIECFIKKIFVHLPRNHKSGKMERFLNGVVREHRSCRGKRAFQK